ncbi:flavoprotein [Nonomuraea sp. NPDC000554]|uniref:flavoprotein n=1 Tax=Nonomuraea sp. NPDC000554 TaxID=3154259 RepID=UPI0033175403
MTVPSAAPPRGGFSRLLVVATGSLAASNLPFALALLRGSRPDLRIRVLVTRSAERFVTRTALAAEAEEVMADEWPQDVPQARHVELADWAEVVVVYPMTLHFMGRLALGLADSPALLAAQCTGAVVALAPALPPGGVQSFAYQSHWAALSERPNVVLVPPRPGISAATGRPDTWVPATLAQVVDAVDARWDELAHAGEPGSGPVEEDGTEFLRMEVVAEPPGFVWRRRPGRLAPAPFAPVDPELNERLAKLCGAADVRFVPGEPDGEFRSYRVGGRESAARLLLRDGPGESLERLVRGAGQALRELHGVAPGSAGRVPHGTRRLQGWLAGRSPSGAASAAAALLADRLGPTSWDRLRRWSAEQYADPDVTLAHGAPGLGALAVTGEFLVGEDLCAAPWYHDLAWLAGELVELRWLRDGDPHDWQRLLDALFEGYGRDLGAEWNRHVATRVALHLHDICAYVGLDVSLVGTYAGFLDFLINVDGGSPHARTA